VTDGQTDRRRDIIVATAALNYVAWQKNERTDRLDVDKPDQYDSVII